MAAVPVPGWRTTLRSMEEPLTDVLHTAAPRAAAGQLRTIPSVGGRAPIPITSSPSDVSLAVRADTRALEKPGTSPGRKPVIAAC